MVSIALFALGVMLKLMSEEAQPAAVMVFMTVYLLTGWSVVCYTFRNLLRGRVFNEHFLMTVATFGAFALGDWAEGAGVMLFWQIGEAFQERAVARSRKLITGLMAIRPEKVHLVREGGTEPVPPEQVAVGQAFQVFPGERVPLDGTVLSGESTLDCSALTGESLPQQAAKGSAVLSGSINLTGLLTLRADKVFHESAVAKILALMAEVGERKARAEAFITRFARIYTPIVTFCALLLAVVPPLFSGAWGAWIYRALTFLVISCPCALVISVPLTFFAGMGAASRRGILVKGGHALESLAMLRTLVFDKTGTLTKGIFEITRVISPALPETKLMELAAHAEHASTHPLARAILRRYPNTPEINRIQAIEEHAGIGVSAKIDGHAVLVGNRRLMEQAQVILPDAEAEAGTPIWIAVDGRYAGHLIAEDTLKPGTPETLDQLRALGVKHMVLLSGDRAAAAQKVADELHLDGVHAPLLPAEKVEQTEALLKQLHSEAPAATLAFVGDGINDAPVLACADVGIAMGGGGSDAAIEAADVVLMTDDPKQIADAIRIARKTLRIAQENIAFAIGTKGLILLLSVCGFASLWLAVFADVGVAFLAILNALRALR